MISWIDRNDELPLPAGHIRERCCRINIGSRTKVAHQHEFFARRASFEAVASKTPIAEQTDQSLLLGVAVENGDIDLLRFLSDGIVENDLQKPFAEFVAVHRDFEGPDFQTATRPKWRFYIHVWLQRFLDLQVKECDQVT